MNVEQYYLAAAYPDVSEVEIWKITRILAEISPGDGNSWAEEFDWLITHHEPGLNELIESISRDGLTNPLLIGPDKRIWDGHHRLWCLYQLGYRYIPVELL